MFRRSLALLVVAACGGRGNTATTDHVVPDGDGIAPDTYVDPGCLTPGVLPALKAQLVINMGLVEPIFLAQPPGSTDLYVVEKAGRIQIVRGGAVAGTFLDVRGETLSTAGTEAGMMSMVFDPAYVTSGRYWLYVTIPASNGKGDRAVVREYHRVSADTSSTTPAAEFGDIPTASFNIGGTIAFGPDHALWVSTGDGGNDPEAQDLTSRRGKLLRFDVDNPGTPPAGNLGGAADPFVWDYGLRNPFRMSFDRVTGDLYIDDGADTRLEEVDLEPPNMGHRDYGWPRYEGTVCHDGSTSCGATGTPPLYTRMHQIDFSVSIGGAVYRGASIPCLRGRYIFGIFGTTGRVLSWVPNGAGVTSEIELTDMLNVNVSNIVDFGEDDAGEMYLVTLDGSIYKLAT